MATKLYLRELKTQLDLVNEEIKEIQNRGTTDVWGLRVREKDRPEYRRLLAKRQDLKKRIINYE